MSFQNMLPLPTGPITAGNNGLVAIVKPFTSRPTKQRDSVERMMVELFGEDNSNASEIEHDSSDNIDFFRAHSNNEFVFVDSENIEDENEDEDEEIPPNVYSPVTQQQQQQQRSVLPLLFSPPPSPPPSFPPPSNLASTSFRPRVMSVRRRLQLNNGPYTRTGAFGLPAFDNSFSEARLREMRRESRARRRLNFE